MSDENHHGHHEHRSGRGTGTNWAMVAGWAVAILLAANLIWGRIHEDGGRPQGFVSETILLTVAFWVPVVALAATSVAGFVWCTQTYRRREKSSVMWTRHAFTFGLVAALAIAAVTYVPQSVNRQWLASIAACLLAGQSGMFAYAAFRENRRTLGGGRGGRHGSSHESDDE